MLIANGEKPVPVVAGVVRSVVPGAKREKNALARRMLLDFWPCHG